MVPRPTRPGQEIACYNPLMSQSPPAACSFSRLAGAALGAMCGDALGMPVEGWSAAQIDSRFGRLDRMLPGRLPAGSYTDDSQMMIAILQTLAQQGSLDPAYLAGRFLALYDPGRGYGGRIHGLMRRLAAGEAWDRVATDSWGNGGAMRVGVLGVFYAHDEQACLNATLAQCRLAHTHPQGLAGAAAQALAVRRAANLGARGRQPDPGEFIAQIASSIEEIDSHVARRLRALPPLSRSPRRPCGGLCLRRVRRRGGSCGPGRLFGGQGPGRCRGFGRKPGGRYRHHRGHDRGLGWGLLGIGSPAPYLAGLPGEASHGQSSRIGSLPRYMR